VGLIETIPIVRGDIKVFWIRTARNMNSERTVCLGELQYTSAFKTRFRKVQKSCLRQRHSLSDCDCKPSARRTNLAFEIAPGSRCTSIRVTVSIRGPFQTGWYSCEAIQVPGCDFDGLQWFKPERDPTESDRVNIMNF
jgi:hypothetical protein